MQTLNEQQILEKYEQLPEDLKSAIFSVEMGNTIKAIGDRYKLMIDKIGALGNEAGMVMLGLTHPNEFIPNLAERLSVDKETARKIADDVNQQIFSKVRESLKAIHGLPSDLSAETSVKAGSLAKEGISSQSSVVSSQQLTPNPSLEREGSRRGEFSGTTPTTSDVKSVSPTSDVTETKEQILKELEKDEPPPIFQGTTRPVAPASNGFGQAKPEAIFDAKMKDEVFRIPPEVKKYQGGDPYREPIN